MILGGSDPGSNLANNTHDFLAATFTHWMLPDRGHSHSQVPDVHTVLCQFMARSNEVIRIWIAVRSGATRNSCLEMNVECWPVCPPCQGWSNAKEKAEEIINKKLSVRQVEKNTSGFKKKKKRIKIKDPNIADLEKELSEKIGLKTSIHFNEEGSSGSLTLYYSDLDQLDDIMKRLKK